MEKVKEALNQAYAGEAKAALRLKVYAEKAEDEGYSQLARLFRVIAFSEENGTLPEECPVCGVKSKMFTAFEG